MHESEIGCAQLVAVQGPHEGGMHEHHPGQAQPEDGEAGAAQESRLHHGLS